MPANLIHSLARLQGRLQSTVQSSFQNQVWGAPQEMTKALSSVKSRFDNANVAVNERTIGKVLHDFRTNGDLPSFVELKYVCLGLAQRIGRDEWRLIDDEKLFPALLKRVDKERPQPRRFRKCYQGLMHSYFSFNIFDNPTDAARQNWQLLQKYLRERLEVALSASNAPTWLKTLAEHDNLISVKTCERYSEALLRGDSSELARAGEGIGFARDSWIWQEAMLAYTKAVIAKKVDDDFKGFMKPLLDLLAGKGDITLSPAIVTRCVALLLVRYTDCRDRLEHAALRDIAVNVIGNPWLRRAAWDAEVKNETARKMVDGWLKSRLITDFFALLSEEGATDERRLKYWLRFSTVIEDMWFALGSHARSNTSAEFREMCKRMEGRLHYLEGSGNTSENNAFIMRIGNLMAVEFGVNGNACYVFQHSDFKVDLEQRFIDINDLKARNYIGRLIHRADWESDFDAWLCPRIGWQPEGVRGKVKQVNQSVKPSAAATSHKTAAPKHPPLNLQALKELASWHGLKINDQRAKGGAIWVIALDNNQALSRRLIQMGFTYKAMKGWWRE